MTVTPRRADDAATLPPARTGTDTGSAPEGTGAGTDAAPRTTGPGTDAAPHSTCPGTDTGIRENADAADGVGSAGGTRTDKVDPADTGSAGASSRRFLAKAALVTVGLSIVGALLGLGRDQALAHLFGAGSETDAFLVAWTVPEFAATLLIEDGLAFVLVPLFSRAAALLIAGAPYVVEVLAPGLPDPAPAVDCTRLTATCVLSFGLAGYCSAALRAHRRFVAPAAIYVAYNTGIITTMFVLGGRWGVRSAAAGVAVGGALMVVTQLPSLWRQVWGRSREERPSAADGSPAAEDTTGRPGEGDRTARSMDLVLVATVLLFALFRQSQVLVERFLASSLPAGAISHLNYAQKVAQMPMVLSLMLCTVTFPVVAQALAEGDTRRARDRVERDLALVSCTVLLGAAAVVACAPQMIRLLFERGAFGAGDTAATAAVMRVYALGLLGHTLVGALVRSYFSAGRPTWYPMGAMAAGIVTTACAGAWAVGPWGVCGIAAANALGITVSALLLLSGMGRHGVPIRTRQVVTEISRPARAAVAAAAAGAFCASRTDSAPAGLAAGGTAVVVVFVLVAWALNAQAVAPALRSVTRRLPHVRFR
jgi:putative peptidoglycan lipid II flippase